MIHRFSVLSYANALPLVYFIEEISPGTELLYCTPRNSINALLNSQVDAALVPVVDFFAHPDLQMISGLGIGADGDVTSVLLQCHCPLRKVTQIGLDPESKTSNTLVQVLVEKHFRLPRRVEYTRSAAETDANVCIGDRALRAAPALESYDLAGEWKKMTGLPFVFAVWVVRRSCRDAKEITQVLQKARDLGCRSRGTLARLCSLRLGLSESRCYEYLANRLHYDLSPRALEGMNLFRELAAGFLTPATEQTIRTVPSRRERYNEPTLERR